MSVGGDGNDGSDRKATAQVRVHVRIHGRVQGVWYRGWTVDRARGLGLDGWVRNCRDGTVEAVFAGPAGAVAEMVAACRDGPPASAVTDIETTPAENVPAEDEQAAGFRQLPTQ